MDDVFALVWSLSKRFGMLTERCCQSCCNEDVSLVQSQILYEISRREGRSMQAVAEALGEDLSTFSRQIKTLEGSGKIQRVPNPEDRRSNQLFLTELGKRTEERIRTEMNRLIREMMAGLSDFEAETVVRSLALLDRKMGEPSRAIKIECCK